MYGGGEKFCCIQSRYSTTSSVTRTIRPRILGTKREWAFKFTYIPLINTAQNQNTANLVHEFDLLKVAFFFFAVGY